MTIVPLHHATISHRQNLPEKTELKQVIPYRKYTKGNNYRIKNIIYGSYHNNNLGKDKSYIDIIQANPKKVQKYNTANSPEEKNEGEQKKVQDKEEKSETISIKPSDTNADVNN